MLKRIISIAMLSVTMLLAAGCGKDTPVQSGADVIRYGVGFSGQEPGRKATLVNDEETLETSPGQFTCSVYNESDGNWLYREETVSYSDGKWSTATQYSWINGKTMKFYAYALATGTDVTVEPDGMSISSHVVADTASSQKDLMLGSYSGTGDNGKATIKFCHPLTAVRFKMGDIKDAIPGFTGVTAITIERVAASGALAKWSSGAFSWTPSSTTKTVTLTVNANPDEGAYLGDHVFALIPVTDLSESPVKISVNYSYSDGSAKSGIVSASIGSGSWEAGKVYTYTVNFKNNILFLTIDDSEAVSEWDVETGATVDAEDACYVVIPAKYDGTHVTGLKWYKQNLAVSPSAYQVWKNRDGSPLKVPGTDEYVIIGDFFQWAAYAGYCGNGSDSDKGLLVYTAFDMTDYFSSHYLDTSFKEGMSFYDYDLYNCSPYYDRSSSMWTKYVSDSHILEATDDVANIILGGGWRLPTEAEFQAMIEATYWAIDDTDYGYYVFTPDDSHPAGEIAESTDGLSKEDALLFFPLAGCGNNYNPKICEVKQKGHYWTRENSSDDPQKAMLLYLYNSPNYTPSPPPSRSFANFSRVCGLSVRPVSE